MNASIYEKNPVMKMVGFQSTSPLFQGGLKDLKFIADAYGYENTPEILFNAFLLGCIYGKRAERLKRQNGSSSHRGGAL